MGKATRLLCLSPQSRPASFVTMRKLLIFCIFFAVSCSTNPVTQKKELSFWSEQDEIKMGESNYGPFIQSYNGVYSQAEVQSYVREVGQKLAKLSHRPNIPYEFTVVNSSVINAFALPGGKIVITRGLLDRFTNESQLAAVLGHEIGHVTAKHGINRMAKEWLFQNLYVYGDMLAYHKSPHYKKYRNYYTTAGQLGLKFGFLAYSRSQEAQSDELGLDYMVKAGYHPQGMVELQQIFLSMQKTQPTLMDELSSTHPLAPDRVEAAQKAIETKYQEAIKTQKLITTSDKFPKIAAFLKKDSIAYAFYDKASTYAAQGQWPHALLFYKQASDLKPEEALFQADLGSAFTSVKNYRQGEEALQKAISLNPQLFKAQYFMGHLQYLKGNHQEAISHLLRARQLLPFSSLVSYMLADSYEKMGVKEQAIINYHDVLKLSPEGELNHIAAQGLQHLGAQP